MDSASILFALLLLLIGILCILVISREIRESAIYEDHRLEDERQAIIDLRRMEQRRRKVWSLIDAAYISFNTRTRQQEKPQIEESHEEMRDPWDSISPSHIVAAFEKFLRETRINDQ